MALLFAFIFFLSGAIPGALLYVARPEPRDISMFQFVYQDTPVLLLGAVLLLFLMRWAPAVVWPRFAGNTRAFAAGAAVFAAIAGYAGAYFAALNFPLSMDEFMVVFDADIFRGGHLLAPVAPEWQSMTQALQPIFMFDAKGPLWSSDYLPVNALLHAGMSFAGDRALTAPLLAAIAVIALYGVARLLWPRRPDAALVAVVLLITSSQFIVTAMTPYAMTAHLAFNLVWLWLFLRNTGASHGGALAVGFAATGLHQLVFHPLFAAPFVLSLWLGRRWRLAVLYTIGYAAICLFWVLYRSLIVSDFAGVEGGGLSAFVAQGLSMLDLNLATMTYMPRNLFRFIAWQNPFALVLFIAALYQTRRWLFPLPQLLAGLVLTFFFVLFVVPYQGHGWGYRYMHGLLGSFVLIGTFAWVHFGPEAARMRTAFVACSVFALAMLPVRAWQMHSFTEPYANAAAAIRASDAEVVLVDPTDIWFGGDFVRNDPYLRTRPKVLVLNYLTQAQIALLCRDYKVAVFDKTTAVMFGVPANPRKYPHIEKMRAFMAEQNCGMQFEGVR
jgi:hypothetical protein